MATNDWDRRILPVLRWSIFIQIAFSVISNISPRIFPPEGLVGFEFNTVSLLPIGILACILVLLFSSSVVHKINRRELLFLLISIALLAFLYRYAFPILSPRDRGRSEFAIFRFDNLFFLIIPLVFIAWQYSIKEVVFYCVLITVLEVVPQLLFFEQDSFILFISGMAAVGRGVILTIVGWVENSLVVLQRNQQSQLEEANRKIRKQAAAVEGLAQSQERNRLARELHDTLAHTLSG
ncbi:histidine kinase, partial [bacterium]|nr:histidine kinase [bacterium]